MRIYETGMIGQAVRSRIENTRNSLIHGTQSDGMSFSDILRSLMTVETKTARKTVGMNVQTENTAKTMPSGSSLVYAIQNADTDDTAAAVLSSIGLTAGSGTLSGDAQSLVSSVSLLSSLKNADKATVTEELEKFTNNYNSLLSSLDAQGSTSAYLYARLLRSAASAGEQSLSLAGITADSEGKLTLDPSAYEELDMDAFLAGVSSAVSAVTTYASTVRTGAGLLDFLAGDSGDTGTADYMSSLISLSAARLNNIVN